jgi:putative SOS response-associated peptidase YedK
MCGRFTLRASPVDLSHLFGLAEVPPAEPRYNIAPTQTRFTVRLNQSRCGAKKTITAFGASNATRRIHR